MSYSQSFGLSRISPLSRETPMPVGAVSKPKEPTGVEDLLDGEGFTKPSIISQESSENPATEIINSNNKKSWWDRTKSFVKENLPEPTLKNAMKGAIYASNPIVGALTSWDTSKDAETDNTYDNIQDGITGISFGAAMTGYGEAASVPMDIGNALFSGKRAFDMGKDIITGDRKDIGWNDVGSQVKSGLWHGVEALPFAGTFAAGGRLMNKSSKLGNFMKFGDKALASTISMMPKNLNKLAFKGHDFKSGSTGITQILDAAHGVKSGHSQVTKDDGIFTSSESKNNNYSYKPSSKVNSSDTLNSSNYIKPTNKIFKSTAP